VARFELTAVLHDGRPLTLYIESEFDADGGIFTTCWTSRIRNAGSCRQHRDALGFMKDLRALMDEVAASHGVGMTVPHLPQRIREEPRDVGQL